MSTGATTAFDALVERLEYPMYVVTTAHGRERAGCLVGFVTQASIDPQRLLVCLSKTNATIDVAARAPSLVVHYLSRDNLDLAKLFGEQTGEEVDKFSRCTWRPGPDGVPVILGVRGWVSGQIRSRTDCGDHVAYLIDVTTAEADDPKADQLPFSMVDDLEPGHEA
jgi:flavin reductase (DIM6/NTAB) family NADH-FMN oxidoreductase RutF